MTGRGDLTEEIALHSTTLSYDSNSNEEIESFSDYDTLFAEVRYLQRSGEKLSSEKWFAEQQVTFRVPWRDDVEPAHRVIWESRAYEVTGRPMVIGHKEYIDILARFVE